MSNPIQKTLDSFWDSILIRFLPQYVTPMTFTFIRLFLIPVILLLLALQSFSFALIFFVIAALSDTVDGSLARVRNQITVEGKLLDGLSDKLLIVLLMLFFFYFYPYWIALYAVILLDFIMAGGTFGLVIFLKNKKLPATHWIAKIKMVLEVLSVLVIFAYLILGLVYLAEVALLFLVLAFIFSLASLLVYGYQIFRQMLS